MLFHWDAYILKMEHVSEELSAVNFPIKHVQLCGKKEFPDLNIPTTIF